MEQGPRLGAEYGGRIGYADGTDKGPLYIDENYDLDVPLTNFEKALREMTKEEREEELKRLERTLQRRGNIGRDLGIPGGGKTGKERRMELLNWGTDRPSKDTGYFDDYSIRHRAAEYLDRPYADEHYETGEHFNRGGRIGYGSGTAYPDPNRVVPEGNLKDNLLNIFRNKFAGREQTMPLRGGQIRQDGRGMGNLIPQSFQILEYENYRANGGDLEFNEWKSRQQAAQGGRIGYKKGGDHTDRQRALNMLSGIRSNAQEGGLMDLGGMEKDYRNDGGFVPIGGQERADDVPARLSKNEFVFTADAVRAAGGGDIDKGAEIMENVMENLEQGGNISEESQGLEGARDMFATSQRLEGVL